jgi:hypothetical protein
LQVRELFYISSLLISFLLLFFNLRFSGQIPLNPAKMVLANPVPLGSYVTSLQLFEDLSLSLRHNHQVLLVNSSHLRHSLYSIVYINVSRVKQSEEEISTLFWNVYTEMIQEEKRKKKESEKIMKSDEESDGEQSVTEDDDDDDEDTVYKFPILMIGVPGLPRDASLEIEVIALVDNYLPVIKRKEEYFNTSFRSKQRPHQPLMSFLSFPVEELKTSETDGIHFQSNIVSYPRCLIAGTINVQPTTTMPTPVINLMDVCENVITYLKVNLLAYEMKKSNLSTLVIFYSSAVNVTILGELINKELGKHGFTNTVPILLPFSNIPTISTPCCLKILYYGIDFNQIETRHWISSEN